MEKVLYHVLLEGRRIGPYDRRTIVGMRIKKALTSADLVETADGMKLTVGDLVRSPNPDVAFEPERSGSYSVVQAVHAAWIAETAGTGLAIPGFKGEVEVRVQTRALRISGRFRSGFGWKQDRVKISFDELAHARVRGSAVDLALRVGEAPPRQRLTLELFAPESAGELAAALPPRDPWPKGLALGRRRQGQADFPYAWAALAGTLATVGVVLAWVLVRRF